MRYAWLGLPLWVYASLSLAAGNPPDTPLIQYQGITVTQQDYEAELATFPKQYRAEIAASGKRVHQLLDKIFVYRALAQEAQKAELAKQDPLLSSQIRMAKEEVLGNARLEQLRQQGLAEEPDFEQLAKEKYQAHPDQYQVPERVKVSHILIKSQGNSPEAEKEAKQLAEEVRERALAGDQPFAQLALKYSQDPTVKENKGELGFITRGAAVKPFEKAAFALQKPGEISPVVKSKFGFHIIRLEQHQSARMQPFDQIKQKLIEKIQKEHLDQVVQTHVAEIRNAKGIEMNGEAIENLMKSNSAKNPSAVNAHQ